MRIPKRLRRHIGRQVRAQLKISPHWRFREAVRLPSGKVMWSMDGVGVPPVPSPERSAHLLREHARLGQSETA